MSESNVSSSTTLGRFLTDHRQLHNMTQLEFAKVLGTSGQSVRDIESGARIPSPKIVARFAEALSLPIADLVRLALQSSVDRDGLLLRVDVTIQ